jgi:DNA processing protein
VTAAGWPIGRLAPGGAVGRSAPLDATPAVVTLHPDDPRFPPALGLVKPPVPVLYALGEVDLLARPKVAIIGSRQPTPYGIKVAYAAAREAARADLVVVSGLARGLDARAHRGALDGGGKTIAVLGSGFGVAYPRENLRLMEEIAERGLLLAELPPGSRPTRFSFPRRNRIIVALSHCLLVVEGRIRGGTTNTVGWMDQFGRTVLAVPGRIDEPVAEGPNLLIQSGAKPYLGPQDLLDEFGLTWSGSAAREPGGSAGPRRAPCERSEPSDRRWAAGSSGARAAGATEPAPLDPEVLEALSGLAAAEAAVFDVVTPDGEHVDRLAERCGLAPAALLAALSSLELKGLVTQLPGKRFRLAS